MTTAFHLELRQVAQFDANSNTFALKCNVILLFGICVCALKRCSRFINSLVSTLLKIDVADAAAASHLIKNRPRMAQMLRNES